MRRFVIGTAGHVDHGKTTLVGALTGVNTDRLPEEKRRGITIELGFAAWSVAGEPPLDVSVVDVPGHRRLVHTMIAGASGIELVLLVVAADEGVMPQTREHLAVCELLGLRRVVVAVTKCDRVPSDLAELAAEEVRELCTPRFEVDVARVSAKTGEGLAELAALVRRALLALPARDPRLPARLGVDRAFSVRGAGAVVTGTLASGTLEVGKPLRVLGPAGERASAVRGLHVHDRPVERVAAPSRVAVNLSGIAHEDLHRGDLVTSDALVAPTRLLDVELTEVGKPIRTGSEASVYVGTARTAARVRWLERPTAEAPGIARLRLTDPLVAVAGDRFVLRGADRGGPSGAVRGGGRVLDARPPEGRLRRERRAVLESLRAGDATAAARALLAEAGGLGLTTPGLDSRLAIATPALLAAMEGLTVDRADAPREALRVKGLGFVSVPVLERLVHEARDAAKAWHVTHPLERGLPLATVRMQLAKKASPRVVEEAVALACTKAFASRRAGDVLVQDADVVRLSTFSTAEADLARTLATVEAAVEAAGLTGITERVAADTLALPAKELRTALARLARERKVVAVADLWFGAKSLDALRAAVEAHFAVHARLTIAHLKDLSSVGRRQIIPLLELFDREGLTRREGDERVRGPKCTPKPS